MIWVSNDLYILIANHNKAKNPMEIYYKEFRQKLIQFFLKNRITEDSKILDIGCQFGDLSLPLASSVSYLVGLDLSIRSIKGAKDNIGSMSISNAYFIVADAESLPFESNSFDVILFIELIEHLPDAKPSLSEIHRVLKPNGFLLIGTPQSVGFFNVGFHLLVSFLTLFFKISLIFKTRKSSFFSRLQDYGIEFSQPDTKSNNAHSTNKTKTKGGHVQKYNRQRLIRIAKNFNFSLVKEGGVPLFLTRMIKYYFAFPWLANIYRRLFTPKQSFLLSRFGNQSYLLFRSQKRG